MAESKATQANDTGAAADLLRLLAEGAPAEELSALSAADPEAAQLALRVHRTLGQHRRRENRLSALFETAGDLAASRDLDAVLQAIVRRARMLLGTDTAYLTLPDEEAGDTYMRVTDGSVSALFQQLRLELGEGLGGLVAQTARPYATPDYRTDARFRHTRSIDAGVVDEGLVGILGVPLLLGSSGSEGTKVIGVLFAADRSPRPFAPDEVALLCSLAAHAAIAIDTARAMEDTRAALAELAGANEVIREHAAAMQRAEQAHDRLTDLVLRGGEVPAVTRAVAGLLGGAVTLHDPEGRPLSSSDGGPAADEALRAAVVQSRTAGRAVPHDGGWVCAVLAGPELLGSLVLHDREHLDDPDRRLFERAGVVTALLLLLRRSVAEAENRVRGELVADLLSAPHRDPAHLVERGRRLGVDLDRPHLVLVAETGPDSRHKLAGAAGRYPFGSPGVSAEHAGAVVLLLPEGDSAAGEVARAAAHRLGRLAGAPVTVAAAGPAEGPQALVAAHAEAQRCLRALKVVGRLGDGACAAELGFLGVLLGDGHDVDGFVGETLGPLLEYDARRGTGLVHTLDAYFRNGGSLTRAKDDLHVHINTVVQRLDRVQALLGPDWNSPGRALELHLALRLHRLTGPG
ncbi:helix-turn-helix domain-containing protein [Streptacidiphilus carbonis]|uniref:helix-turn-helix domain-containing protein n=1 Tax=Streptacidiphilus carbonis TaxID=105422 RepID=UPI0005A728D1|nr:GAF domain-containing protein [Streptacidiphilus carbonis]